MSPKEVPTITIIMGALEASLETMVKSIVATIWKLVKSKLSGTMELTNILSQLIQEAKRNNVNLTCVWIDLAYTYGTIPPNIVDKA